MNTAPVFLLVEPSSILSSVLCKWLEYALANPPLYIASDGADALQLAARENPSHVLMEINLPDKKGIDVLRELRQALPVARIIATGWYESPWLSDKVLSAGANGFTVKDKLYSELLSLWHISTEHRIANGKASTTVDH